jgi:tetratricopeptide (TPR) repeat protein
MTSNHLLLYRLAELMLEHEQHILPVDLLFDDEQIGDFVKSIQIDSPYQQMLFEGVLTESVREEKLFVSFTVEGYFHYVLGEVVYSQTKGKAPEALKQIVEENKLNGAKEGVEQCLIRDVLADDLTRLMWLIDEGKEKLELCVFALLYFLKSNGAKKMIEKLLESPTENDWIALNKLDTQLTKLQLHILRNEFLVDVMNFNLLNSKHSIWLGLKAFSIFDNEVALNYLNKIDNSKLEDDEDFLYELGSLEDKYGRYDKALYYFLKSLKIRIKQQGSESLDVASTYCAVGVVYKNKGQFDHALDYYQKALDVQLKILGTEHPDVAILFGNIGVIYRNKEDYEKSLCFQTKSLEINLKTLGSKHPDVATIYNNIGVVYAAKIEFNNALEYYQKALNIQLITHGNQHLDVGTLYTNIGVVYDEIGDFENSLVSHYKTLNIRLKQLGEEHPDVAIAYNNIGAVYKNKSENDNAIVYYQKALGIQLKILGDEHLNSAIFYNNIGVVLSEKGDVRALDYFQKTLEIQLKIFGSEHPSIENTYNSIAAIHANNGNFDSALEYYHKALIIQIKYFGENHPFVLNSYNNIAWAYSDYGELENALEFQMKILNLELKKEIQSPINLAAIYGNIGYIFKQLHKYKDAIKNLKKAFEFEKNGRFPFEIAQCYELLLEPIKALEYYLQSAEIRKHDQNIGIEHKATQEALENAKRLAKELNKENELPKWMI